MLHTNSEIFDVPGKADQVSGKVLSDWNERVQKLSARALRAHQRSKFVVNPADLQNGETTNACKWSINPAMVRACLHVDEDQARGLCDWGALARFFLHTEYAEYKVVYRPDSERERRPKRVIITTELGEYWGALAAHQPEKLREIAEEIIGRPVAWQELYGPEVESPEDFAWDERERRFDVWTAGLGRYRPHLGWHPRGMLNAEHALFMVVPINGLRHLIDIVAFGAQAYVVKGGDDLRREATKYEILGNGGARACRHADATVALTATRLAHLGQTIAFANPLGVYINTDAQALQQSFFYENAPIPEDWIRLSRGAPRMYQRLEFGPGDDDAAFLDDIIVATGAEERAVTGGYDVASKIEVGPLMAIGDGSSIGEDDYVERRPVPEPRPCHQSKECAQFIVPLFNAYKNQ